MRRCDEMAAPVVMLATAGWRNAPRASVGDVSMCDHATMGTLCLNVDRVCAMAACAVYKYLRLHCGTKKKKKQPPPPVLCIWPCLSLSRLHSHKAVPFQRDVASAGRATCVTGLRLARDLFGPCSAQVYQARALFSTSDAACA